jgi:endonuclease/exonuclease/phosphatase family metal-dependent hydrolase
VQEITEADLADMDRAGLADLLPHRAGDPGYGSDAVMVFARTELGEATRTDTWHDGWIVPWGDLTVVATHPQAPTVPDLWRGDHAALLDAVREHDPDLVVGDFNATADHAPMRALADEGYRDVGELANGGWQPTWPSSGEVDLLGLPVPSLAQIDHVLVGARLAAIGMRTRDIPGSDHRAVVAEVAVK